MGKQEKEGRAKDVISTISNLYIPYRHLRNMVVLGQDNSCPIRYYGSLSCVRTRPNAFYTVT